jgi:hypothetical protein
MEVFMVRALLRLILIVLVLVAAAAFFFGYRWGRPESSSIERPVATTGSSPGIDTSRARATGAAIGEKVAVGANKAERVLEIASLTGKIKSKMALDDTVDASRIDVDTSAGGVVTLTGAVSSQAEKSRALQLARETEGVKSVVDGLRVGP